MVEDKSLSRKSNDSNDYDKNGLHPSKDIKCILGNELFGKRVVICVTASVACYKTIDLIRLMMRHGAEVFVVISKAVEKILGRKPIPFEVFVQDHIELFKSRFELKVNSL